MSTSSEVTRRHPKKSAFSCEPCRKRKVKCDGEHPVCNRCQGRQDVCVYKLSPTLSYTQRLERRVADLENALAEARGSLPEFSTSYASQAQGLSPENTTTQTSSKLRGDLQVEVTEKVLPESTSIFHLPGTILRNASLDQEQTHQELDANKQHLVNSAWRERAYEQLTETPEPYRSLMDSHFCWIQPLFNFIYRPTFTRDMKTGGPYFSNALFNAVLAHSIRWCRNEPGMAQLLAPFENGAAFSKLAVTELFHDIQQGNNKIPTVQALLLLSAQQCGSGNRTQAWLYSGMAFRLIDDMGICVDGKRSADSGQLSAEDIEVRNRLFWSCYFWDKLISLYFGRSPMLQNSAISPPRILMDDTAEIETWVPHGLPSSNYQPKQAHSISCFIQMCALAEILNQVLVNLYNPSQEISSSHAYDRALAEGLKLKEWWRQLPDHLKINLAIPSECPPSHIVTLNCLYHTINILLNRAKLKLGRESELASTIAEQSPLIQCVSSATSIIALFDLYRRTFSEGHVVLSLAYCIYTAASIFLLELQALGHSAQNTLERLSFCVGALSRLKKTNPVITTGLDLIMKELQALGISNSIIFSSEFANDGFQFQPLVSYALMQVPEQTFSVSGMENNVNNFASLISNDGPVLLDPVYSNSQAEGSMNYNLLDMPAELYDAFLHVEPISVTMDPGFDMF